MSTVALATRSGRGHEYSEAARLAALMELALCGGSPTRASRRLKERGTPVPRRTLSKWLGTEEYAQVRDEQALQVQKEIAREHEDIAIRAAGVTRKLLTRMDKEADEIPVRDLAGAARNAGTIAGISTDKQMLTRSVRCPPAPSHAASLSLNGR